jgi:hypothetical protein
MANPNAEVIQFLDWLNKIPEDQHPKCWEITGQEPNGTPFVISTRYKSREEAEASLPVVSEWADPKTIKIRRIWDVDKAVEAWNVSKTNCPLV